MPQASIKSYVARICWNTNHWDGPSGRDARQGQSGYPQDAGLGWEEFLCCPEWSCGGKRVAFCQAVNVSRLRLLRDGETQIRLRLIAIKPSRPREKVHIGVIDPCEILTDEAAAGVMADFERKGVIEFIEEQLRSIQAPYKTLKAFKALRQTPQSIVNIRFDSTAFQYAPSPLDPGDIANRIKRYSSLVADAEGFVNNTTLKPTQHIDPTYRLDPIRRAAIEATVIDPFHKRLQLALVQGLRGRYGHKAVTIEEHFCDVIVRRGSRVDLLEIKTHPDPVECIREGLGQALEYCCLLHSMSLNFEKEPIHVGIVGPSPLGRASGLLKWLQDRLSIPLRYYHFNEGMPVPVLAPA